MKIYLYVIIVLSYSCLYSNDYRQDINEALRNNVFSLIKDCLDDSVIIKINNDYQGKRLNRFDTVTKLSQYSIDKSCFQYLEAFLLDSGIYYFNHIALKNCYIDQLKPGFEICFIKYICNEEFDIKPYLDSLIIEHYLFKIKHRKELLECIDEYKPVPENIESIYRFIDNISTEEQKNMLVNNSKNNEPVYYDSINEIVCKIKAYLVIWQERNPHYFRRIFNYNIDFLYIDDLFSIILNSYQDVLSGKNNNIKQYIDEHKKNRENIIKEEKECQINISKEFNKIKKDVLNKIKTKKI
jgi:hypothetical protein